MDRRRPLTILSKMVALKKSGAFPLQIRGRKLTYGDVHRIQRCVEAHASLGRTRLSQMLCERFNWRQPNGWIQERAAREILVRLERTGLLKLPRSKKKKAARPATSRQIYNYFTDADFEHERLEMPSVLYLELAKGVAAETAWNQLVDRFHYLGHKITVGRSLKYLIIGDDQIIGAIAFSSPVWRLKSRDVLLQCLGMAETEWHNKVINNSRFLLAPNVRVKHLASRVLSISAEKVAGDWEQFYSVRPLLAETFVQPSLFHGTSYLAANWRRIGTTRGFAKTGSVHHNSQEPKHVFVYGLSTKMRCNIDRLLSRGFFEKGEQGERVR